MLTTIGAVALAATLAACGGGQPGAAAVVGDRVVRASDVDTATRELADVLQGVTQSAIVGVLVQEPVIARHAEDAGVGVSTEQAEETLDAQVVAAGGQAGREFSDASVTVMRYVMEIQGLQDSDDAEQALTDLQADLGALDFTVSPRYGTAGENGTIGTTTYAWLVPAADDAAAVPAP
ncbi:hypothetical protein [Cellulomonas hominis]|uniref:hypothetical protein n=1 Tax=Cellulomonas hominis TaxID=156981 RepID=UPI001BA39822|nr:hypothetical protein [Cellulomonas hominis]VTR78129.1 hypothetical protein CHMI_02905 [Cellulomonas hominis]